MGEVVGRMVCPDCGTELTPDLPLGLCPKCLLSSKGTLAESVTGEPEPANVSEVSSALGAAWRALSAGAAGESAGDVSDEDLRPPEIQRYRIIRLLGAGGMGAVYEAEQLSPHRTVALKIIRPGKATRRLVRRFRDEAEALARLQHPGIAQIFEFGTTESEGVAAGQSHPRPFFAMELVRGPGGAAALAITDYAKQQNLTVRQRLELVAEVADAVHYAHQKGIIHRDLKPANILLGESGRPKILDFGVARVTDSDVQATTLYDDTHVGQIIGTLPYMSPEQAGGQAQQLDTRSDVYALGVLCYELLSGRLPYELGRLALHEAVRVIREEEPTRLSTVDRALRGDVETIVSTALAKEKERRYPSAAELAADIRRFVNNEPLSARKAGTWYHLSKFARRNKALVGGVAAVFVALVLGLAATAYQAVQASAAREDARQRLRDSYVAQARALRYSGRAGRRFEGLELIQKARAIRDGADLRNEAAAALGLADLRRLRSWDAPAVLDRFDPPARRYAYHHGDGTVGIHSAEDDALLVSLGGAGGGAAGLRFSPDGRYFVELDDQFTVRVWDLTRPEQPPLLAPRRSQLQPDFTADSSALAVATGTELHLFPLPDLRGRTVSLGPPAFRGIWLCPDGKHVCVLRSTPAGDSVDVHDLASGRRLAELRGGGEVTEAAWEPQGDRIATAARDHQVRIWDWREGKIVAVARGHTALVTSVAYSPDGTVLASLSWDETARLWDAESGEELARGDTGGNALQFGSDGRRIAFSGFKADDRRKEVWEVAPAALRTLRGGMWGVAFSPDGRLLASGTAEGVPLWDARCGRRLGTLPSGWVSNVEFRADGRELVTGGDHGWPRLAILPDAPEGTVRFGPPEDGAPSGKGYQVWGRAGASMLDLEPFEQPPDARGKRFAVYGVTVSEDGRWVAATAATADAAQGDVAGWRRDAAVYVWDRQTFNLVGTFAAPTQVGVYFSPDGRWLVARGEGGTRIWRTGSWEVHEEKDPAYSGGTSTFTEDGTVTAVPTSTNRVRLLETGTWRELLALESPQPHHPSGAAFSPDGTRLAVGSIDKVVCLWDLAALRAELARMGLDWAGPPGASVRQDAPRAGGAVLSVAMEGVGTKVAPEAPIPARDPSAGDEMIDLSAEYNVALTESMHPVQGMRNDLSEVGAGVREFGGVKFDVRGVVHLAATPQPLQRFPRRVADIRVRRQCRAIHFLHGAAWRTGAGEVIGKYRIRYADGVIDEVDINYGGDVRDWWQVMGEPTKARSRVAWVGGNEAARAAGKGVTLYEMTWENPRVGVEVVSVDFESVMGGSGPFLVGVTVDP